MKQNFMRATCIVCVALLALVITMYEGLAHASGFWVMAFMWIALAPWGEE